MIPRGELTNSPVNPEALQEFRVITSNAKAEYGRSAGGQVELVTRSGTNSFSGTLYEFLRNTALDSNSYFNEQQGLPKEVLRRNQFGAALGGPIQRDRAFFFINYDGMRRTQETSQSDHRSDGVAAQGHLPIRHAGVRGETAARNRPSCVDASGNPLVPVSSYSFVANDPRRLGLDPVMQEETLAFLPLPNDFSTGDGLNTAGYRWNSPSESPVDTHHEPCRLHAESAAVVLRALQNGWRNDLINDIINTTPKSNELARPRAAVGSAGRRLRHKWTLTSYLLNEITGGFTRNVLDFADPEHPADLRDLPGELHFRQPVRVLARHRPRADRVPVPRQPELGARRARVQGRRERAVLLHRSRPAAPVTRSGSTRASRSSGPMRPSAAPTLRVSCGLTAASPTSPARASTRPTATTSTRSTTCCSGGSARSTRCSTATARSSCRCSR